MSFCLNPDCIQPQNIPQAKFCQSCGSTLLLGDRYRAMKPIGSGSFGRTFLAVDEWKPSKPRCVIKQFLPDDRTPGNIQRATTLFRQEAIRLEELGKHPQIPELLAHFEQDDRLYLVQEFIDGPNLAQELAESGALNEAQIRQLLKDILPVLQFVHDRQVIHRDIKPENIIRQRSAQTPIGKENAGELVLVDFGASKLATGTALSRTGTVIGSAGYVAPEQAFGKAVFASDLYSLGVTCIHLLTHIPPFELFDSSEGTWMWQEYLRKTPISESLERILDKMLESGTSRRYASASAVLQALNSKSVRLPTQNESMKTLRTLNLAQNLAPAPTLEEQTRSRVQTTYILWLVGFFLGIPFRPLKGLHRFYNGKVFTGLLWMIPVIGDVGSLIDLFFIPQIVDEYEQKTRAKLGVSAYGVPLSSHNAVTQTIAPQTHEQKVVKLLKAAQSKGGQLSVTQAVMETGMGFAEVEKLCKEMVKLGYAQIDNDPRTGVVIYRFSEL
jgi:serine/threonine protein kinase